MRKSTRLPTRFPEGTKYVLEAHGGSVRRFIEYPDGRRIALKQRKAVTCVCSDMQEVSIVPGDAHEPKRARRRVRALEHA